MHKTFLFLKKYKIELIIFVSAFIFSSWLMFSSFSYSDGSLLISSKSWSDFASHIPLIRSFSLGNNFPSQYPLFSGPPIKYHFLFYLVTGLLEKSGLRIDFALNIPSILGFSFLILMIYLFAKELFKSKAVGVLSIFLFLFNSSLSFINYFAKHPLTQNSIQEILSNKTFTNFGPYDGGIISAFWNLNIYTNQRHLAISYALSLFVLYVFLRIEEDHKDKNKYLNISVILGIVLGLSFILNMAVFLMTMSVLFLMLIFIGKKRIYLLTTLIISALFALPFYLFMQSGSANGVNIYPGYLVTELTVKNFIDYWLQNLGLNILLIPLGFIAAKRLPRKIFVCFLSLFVIGNIFRFSPEIAANHKFFNYFVIIGGMFTSYFLVILWKKNIILKPLVILSILILTLSGIIDFFPILNDGKIPLLDYPKNKNVEWIIKNTNPNSVFLNSQYLYNYANLAGRKTFLGWPYFAWSQGYDTEKRDNTRKEMLKTNDLIYFCKQANLNNLNYIDINLNNTDAIINQPFFERNFKKVFDNPKDGFIIYNINSKC